MKRPRSRWADFAVYLAVRVLVCVVQALSWSSALTLARGLAWLAHRLDRRHRLVAEDNLRHAFPELDAAAIDRLTRDTYEHLVTMAIEIIRMPRVLHRSNSLRYLRFTSPQDEATAIGLTRKGRPLMALTGHFGNWEILGYCIGAVGFHASLVARRLDNPYLDAFVKYFRRKTGQQLLDKSEDYAKILEVMDRGGTLGMVGDQDAGERGLFVPFMGRPASTFKSIALLSLQYSAPIMVLAAARVGHPMSYNLYLEDVIMPEDYAEHRDPVRAITERYSAALERVVRRHPEQYFWVHRRWKHQPKQGREKKAA